MVLTEDSRPLVNVEFEYLRRRHSHAEPDGDDAAGRGAGNQVKEIADRPLCVLLDRRQEGSRERPEQSTAVVREDAIQGFGCPVALLISAPQNAAIQRGIVRCHLTI